jgi:phosphate/sulfate permease
MLPLAVLAASLAMVASKGVGSPEMGVPFLYTGLIAWAFVWAFVDAYTIGANDVANAFANAVGAGTVSHRTACLIACIFELVGVIALGSQVTDTIRSKVIVAVHIGRCPVAPAIVVLPDAMFLCSPPACHV